MVPLSVFVLGCLIFGIVPAPTAAAGETGGQEIISSAPPRDYSPVAVSPQSYSPSGRSKTFGAGLFSAQSPGNVGSRFLIIADTLPWGLDANRQALAQLGVPYDVINTSGLSDWDFATRGTGVVLIPSDQSSSSYANLYAQRQKLFDFVAAGGVLVGHMADQGWNDGSWSGLLPGGVGHVTSYIQNVAIQDSSHPIVQGVSNSDLAYWNYSTHGYFTNVPAGAATIISAGQPTYIEYSYGAGRVIATMHTIEWGYGRIGKTRLLLNELGYARNLASRPTVQLVSPRDGETISGSIQI